MEHWNQISRCRACTKASQCPNVSLVKFKLRQVKTKSVQQFRQCDEGALGKFAGALLAPSMKFLTSLLSLPPTF